MKVKIILFLVLFLPFSVNALTDKEKEVWDLVLKKLEAPKYKDTNFIPVFEKAKTMPKYSRLEEVFDYMIFMLENPLVCEEIKSCKVVDSCSRAYDVMNYCNRKSLDRDNDSIPCENICK